MSEAFLGEIRVVSFDFAPRGWARCDGQLLQISTNQALFSLLGTQYGGNGQTTFALPDLRGRVPLHFSSTIVQGQIGGEAAHTLLTTEIPQHNHAMAVDTSVASTSNVFTPAAGLALGQSSGSTSQGGTFAVNNYNTNTTPAATLAPGTLGASGAQPHENRQPFLTLNYVIALSGIFPSRN